MSKRIIDCCSLINLYTGWRGLDELQALGHSWYVADSLFKEAQYTREIGVDGKITTVPINLDPFIQSGLLEKVGPVTPEETELFVRLSAELDDGEAEAMAIAKSRELVLLTDDAKAIQIAQKPELLIRTISTVQVLEEWLSSDPSGKNNLIKVIRRIETLARFRPRAGTEEADWWIERCRAVDP